jgi:hypothetical protein
MKEFGYATRWLGKGKIIKGKTRGRRRAAEAEDGE